MAGMPDEINCLLSQMVLPLFLALLLLLVCYLISVTMGKPQEKRPKKHQHKGKKRHARAFVPLKSSRLSRKCYSEHLVMESICKTIHKFTRAAVELTSRLEMLHWRMPERSNSSWTTISGSEEESCSKVPLSPFSDNSWNSVMARNVEAGRCLEPGSMHQHKRDFQIQLGAPGPTPEKRDMEGRKTQRPMAQQKSQNTVEAFNPEKKLQQEQGQPAREDQTLQDATVSASPSRKPQKPCDMRPLVLPIIQDPLFLDRAVKSQLEKHIVKKKIQRRYGLPSKVLEYERNSEATALIKQATQPPAMQRRSVWPYRSPFDHWDRNPQGKKAAGEQPGSQKKSANAVETCSRGISAPSTQSEKACDVLVFPIIRDPPFLDRPLKSQLEKHNEKMKTQRPYGVPSNALEYGRNAEVMALRKEAVQPPLMQTHSELPYRSPFDRCDRNPQGKKAAREHPGPQKQYVYPACKCSRGIPAPSTQSEKACDVLVFPIVREPPFLYRPLKSQLEKHIVKKKIQRCYGLPSKVLKYERNSETTTPIKQAMQPPFMQRRSVRPYRSPFDRCDRNPQGKKAAREHPGPQKESAHPACKCSRGMPAPSAQPQKTDDEFVFRNLRHPLFLYRAVKRKLEKHIEKMKTQQCCRLLSKVLEYERNSEDTALRKEAAQPPAMQRRSELPYRPPFNRCDRNPQGKKAAREHPGPQKESAHPACKCSRGIPAPSARPEKAREVLVSPIVRDPPFLDKTVKSKLEKHIEKMKIQRCYGLPSNALEYERISENTSLRKEAAQPPLMQRRSELPYCPPFSRCDRNPQGKKAAREHPGPQKQCAHPACKCSRGIPAPSAQPQKAREALVFPIVRDPERRQEQGQTLRSVLEKHIKEMKIQQRNRLPSNDLEQERNSEDPALTQEAAQQRRSVLPHRSPFDSMHQDKQGP